MVNEEVTAPRGSEAQLHFVLGNAPGMWLSFDNRTPVCLSAWQGLGRCWNSSSVSRIPCRESFWKRLETWNSFLLSGDVDRRGHGSGKPSLWPCCLCCVGRRTPPWGAAPFFSLLSFLLVTQEKLVCCARSQTTPFSYMVALGPFRLKTPL